MPIKMIVTDLDSTLLGADSTLSERTKSALAKCRAAGVKVAYATARGASAEYLVPDALVDGQIRMNGAVARAGERIVYECLVSSRLARPLLVACNARRIKITAELCRGSLGVYYVNEHRHIAGAPPHKQMAVVDFATHDADYEKIFMVGLTADDEVFVTQNLPDDLYFLMARGDDGFGMIMHKDATKAKATAALAAHWGIKPSEIAAFGDDLNDMDLLAYAGIGVAMGNALDEVKDVADHVCRTNTENGVARWLEENIL